MEEEPMTKKQIFYFFFNLIITMIMIMMAVYGLFAYMQLNTYCTINEGKEIRFLDLRETYPSKTVMLGVRTAYIIGEDDKVDCQIKSKNPFKYEEENKWNQIVKKNTEKELTYKTNTTYTDWQVP